MYKPKAAQPGFWENQRLRRERLCREVEKALDALPLRDWERILSRAEKRAGRGTWPEKDLACLEPWQAAWVREVLDRRGLWNWPQAKVPDDREHPRSRNSRKAPECRREPRVVHGEEVVATICPTRKV